MTARTRPFTLPQRRRLCGVQFGRRPRCNWDMGALPAPYAIGDMVHIDDTFDRLGDVEPGYLLVVAAWPIDEGDAWYFRVANSRTDCSGRLHVNYPERSTWAEAVDWMARFTLIDTADPDGLEVRARMLAAGWQL